ncbi:MAG TPA: tetratricopeptide repeat protein [Blastocatellia bacterium]|nr:tetratricopeptide repeat protein [Blastocatellia bacterium]
MPKTQQSSRKSPGSKGSASRANAVIETESEQRSQSEASESPGAFGKWQGVYALVPVILALITSINALWNHFASDDLEQVLGNTFIKHFGNLPAAFTSSVWSFTAADIIFTVDPYFRPIFSSLFTLNYALFGTAPWGWHLVNVLIHTGVTLLVFVISREITERNWVAALTAMFFAVHPAHAESVAWVSGVTDPLMTLLLLPAFYFYLRFRKQGGKYLLGCALGFFFLALLSKETAIALPVVVAYCELFHFKGEASFTNRLVRALRLMALFAIPTAIYFLMRYHALSTLVFSGQPRYPLVPSLLTVPLAILKYLGLMLVPWGYSYQHYTDFVETAGSALFLAPIGVLAAIAIGVALLKSRELTFAAVWFIVMLAPALASLRQFEPAYLLQERYLYAPSIGVCLAIALGIEWLAARDWFGSRGRVVAATVAAVLMLVWGAVFVRQNRVWDDTVTVYKNSVAVSPRAPLAHVLLSRSYYDAGKPREAETEARTALDLDSHCATAYLTLSYFARMSGKLDKACGYLEDGISAVSEGTMTRHDLATIHLNLGLLYGQRKMFERAEQQLLRSIEISPRAVAWYHTGQFYFDQGRYEDARAMFEQTLEHVPRWFAPIHLRLGLTYEALTDISRAEAEFEKYLELAPPDAPDRDSVRKHLVELRGGPPSK